MNELHQGEQIGEYVVEADIGGGGSARVYRVRRVRDGQLFALKVMKEAVAFSRARFLREGEVLAGIRIPGLVNLEATLHVGGSPALLLQWIDGPTLHDWMKGDGARSPLAERLDLFGQVLRRVGLAHEQGLVHRDLKPANVLLTRRGSAWQAWVADFGLVKLLSPDAVAEHLTRTGVALGTIGYMAPEQALDAKRVDHRADLWSLGCLLYQLCTRVPPFPGRDLYEVQRRARLREFRDPREWAPDLPEAVVGAIDRCLQPEPGERPQTAGELARHAGLQVDVDGTPPPHTVPPPSLRGARPPPAGSSAAGQTFGSGDTLNRGGGSQSTIVPDDWWEDDDPGGSG